MPVKTYIMNTCHSVAFLEQICKKAITFSKTYYLYHALLQGEIPTGDENIRI